MSTEIHYSIAQLQVVDVQQVRHQQAERLNAFRNSFCDMCTIADFRFYAEVTGKDVGWLVDHAKWKHPLGMWGMCFSNAVIDKDDDTLETLFLER